MKSEYIGRNGGQHQINFLKATKYHFAKIRGWKKLRGHVFECGQKDCKEESKYSIHVIIDAGKDKFLSTTSCDQHIEEAKKHFITMDKSFVVFKINKTVLGQ